MRSGINMVSVIVPILVSYLCDADGTTTMTGVMSRLHDIALQKLIDIGPQYPAQFRSVMHGRPDLRARLEAAVKSQQNQRGGNRQTTAGGQSGAAAAAQAEVQQQQQRSSIKLKMDFSNFVG